MESGVDTPHESPTVSDEGILFLGHPTLVPFVPQVVNLPCALSDAVHSRMTSVRE